MNLGLVLRKLLAWSGGLISALSLKLNLLQRSLFLASSRFLKRSSHQRSGRGYCMKLLLLALQLQTVQIQLEVR